MLCGRAVYALFRRERDIVVHSQTVKDRIHLRLRVVFSQGHFSLFQLAAGTFRPHIGVAIRIHYIIGRKLHGRLPFSLAVARIRLNIHVLSQHQALLRIQGHIKRIFRGSGHLVAAAMHIIIVLHRILKVDTFQGTRPGLSRIDTGTNQQRRSLLKNLGAHLVHGPFHLVRTGFHQSDIRVGALFRTAHIHASF